MQEIKKHISNADVPRPSNDELVQMCLEIMAAIEKCGASPELTAAVIKASDLYYALTKAEPTAAPQSAQDDFCDGHCTWRNHHPECVRADEKAAVPVAMTLECSYIERDADGNLKRIRVVDGAQGRDMVTLEGGYEELVAAHDKDLRIAELEKAASERKPVAWAVVMPDGIRQIRLTEVEAKACMRQWSESYAEAVIKPLYE